MFSSHIKKTGLLLCIAALCSCGLFADDKVLPSGTRVAVLAPDHTPLAAQSAIPLQKLPAPQLNLDWAQRGGNAFHVMGNISGHSNMKESWKNSFGKGSSKRNLLLAQPVIYQNKVYAQDVEGTVSAFALSDGKKLWKQKLKSLRPNENESSLNGSGIAAENGKIFAATGFGGIFALDAESGKTIWRKDLETPVRTAPSVCGNKLLIQTLDNRFFTLDTQDGTELWQYTLPAEDTVLAGGSVPACQLDKNLVIAGFSNGEIQAFNAGIGYPLWSASLVNAAAASSSTDINAIKASPAIDGDTVYAIGHNDLAAAIDYRTGEKKWEQKIGGVNLPWVAGDYLFIVSNTNEVLALNKTNGQILWSVPLLEEYSLKERNGLYLSGPVMINSQLIITSSNGMVYALSPENGKIQHQLDLGSPIPYAPAAAENNVVFVTDNADLIVYK